MATYVFDLVGVDGKVEKRASVALEKVVIAGWAGRDAAAIEHHIVELEAVGVPRPSAVPLFYNLAVNQLNQDKKVQVLGSESSGEVEAFIFSHNGKQYVSIASDHTDRQLETYSVAHSKQICIKPVATSAWLLEDVIDHWDQLIIRSWINEDGERVLYQEGSLSSLLPPMDLIARCFANSEQEGLPNAVGMLCGTVPAIGGIRPANNFEMELQDPILNRFIQHSYQCDVLSIVA